MYGITEFNIFREDDGWYVSLVDGKKNKVVMKGVQCFKSQDAAYRAAELLWKRLVAHEKEYGLPVRCI